MTNILRGLIAALASIACIVTAHAGGPFGIIRVGLWQGAAYTNDKGAFSHCMAVAKFEKGAAIILAQNADRTWIIGVTDPSWQVRERESLSLVLTFDNQAKFESAATVGAKKVVIGGMPAQGVEALRKARQLIATANKQTVQLDLAAAGNVVPSIENCVEKMKASGVAAAGDFPTQRGNLPRLRRRRSRKTPPNRRRNRKDWPRFPAAVLSSAKTPMWSPITTSSATASVRFRAISRVRPP